MRRCVPCCSAWDELASLPATKRLCSRGSHCCGVQAAVARAKEQLLGLHEELEALLQAQAEAGKA